MFCFAKICCLCLQYNADLYKMEERDPHGVTFFEKLIVLIPGFEDLVKKSIPNYICRKCKRYLNKFFKFQQNSLKSYKLLQSYVKQLNTPGEATNPIDKDPELHVIEDDLILIKEDMEECLKNMEIYVKVEDTSHEMTNTPTPSNQEEEQPNNSCEQTSPKADVSSRKRTRECKKISYNEDYDSDTVISDSELYYTKGAKRKPKPRKESNAPKRNKTVVIPQNDIFAKDLTKTLNDIITRLAADNVNTSQPEEFKVKFKNSSGNTEHLSIHQDKDSVEVRFTKEEKMGYLKVCPLGDSFVLTHNMSDSSGDPPPNNIPSTEQLEVVAPENSKPTLEEEVVPTQEVQENHDNEKDQNDPKNQKDQGARKIFKKRHSLTKHMKNFIDSNEKSCKICDKTFEQMTDLKNHISHHSSAEASPAEPETTGSQMIINPSIDTVGLRNVEAPPSIKEPPSPRTQCCEIKVVLSEIQENQMKSERSSSPEYQFHLSDDSDDEFDNDTIILGALDHENDFSDTRSPSPVDLGSEVLEFLQENDILKSPKAATPNGVELPEKALPQEKVKRCPSPRDISPPFAGFPRESVETKSKEETLKDLPLKGQSPNKKDKNSEDIGLPKGISPRAQDVGLSKGIPPSSEDVLPPSKNSTNLKEISSNCGDTIPNTPERSSHFPNGKESSPEPDLNQNKGKPATNGVDLNGSFEEKRLKIVINKLEVDEYFTKKQKRRNQKDRRKKKQKFTSKQTRGQ